MSVRGSRPIVLMQIAAVICMMTTAMRAQSPSSELARLMADGSAAQKASKYDEAFRSFEQAVQLARAEGLELFEARALLSIAEVDFRRSHYDSSLNAATRAHDIAEKVGNAVLRGRAYYYLGLVAERVGRADDAFKHFEAAVNDLTATDDPLLATALGELLSAQRIDPVSGADRYRQALALAERSGEASRIGGVWHMWGDQLFAAGENEAALEKYDHAITVFSEGNRLDDLGTVYNSLGRLYRRHGQVEIALDYQQRALRIHEKSSVPFFRMQSLNAVGVTLQALGRFGDSRPYFERAVAVAREAKNVRMEDFVGANLASTLLNEGAFEAAASLLEGVIARKLDLFPSVRYMNLAAAYIGLGRLDQALDAANQSVAMCGDRRDLTCVDALQIRSKVYLARNQRAAALTDLEQAVTLVEDARKRLIPADFLKQQFDRTGAALFGRAIELQLGDGRARQALETAEQARARAFLDLLASRNLPLAPERAAAINDNTSQRRSDLTAPSPKTDDLIAIATRLQSTLLVYWVATDRVFIWTLSPAGELHATTVPILESRLADLVAATAPFGDGSSRSPASPWGSLYDTLIKPVREHLPTAPGALVTIVPTRTVDDVEFCGAARSAVTIPDRGLHAALRSRRRRIAIHRPRAIAGNREHADHRRPRTADEGLIEYNGVLGGEGSGEIAKFRKFT